jgi:hypothetical protein
LCAITIIETSLRRPSSSMSSMMSAPFASAHRASGSSRRMIRASECVERAIAIA